MEGSREEQALFMKAYIPHHSSLLKQNHSPKNNLSNDALDRVIPKVEDDSLTCT
jgi:hypothetical protein